NHSPVLVALDATIGRNPLQRAIAAIRAIFKHQSALVLCRKFCELSLDARAILGVDEAHRDSVAEPVDLACLASPHAEHVVVPGNAILHDIPDPDADAASRDSGLQ